MTTPTAPLFTGEQLVAAALSTFPGMCVARAELTVADSGEVLDVELCPSRFGEPVVFVLSRNERDEVDLPAVVWQGDPSRFEQIRARLLAP